MEWSDEMEIDCMLDNSLSIEDKRYFDINFRRIVEDIVSKYNIEDIVYNMGDIVSEKDKHKLLNQILINRFNGLNGYYHHFVENENDNNLNQLIEENFMLVNYLVKAIPLSFEFFLDIIDEILLSIIYEEKEAENLFIEGQTELNENMKNTIHNIKKPNLKYYFLFDPQIIQSTSQIAKIPVIGSGLIRLWLSSPEFRNLFIETVTRYEKYEVNKIYTILDNSEKMGIQYKLHDHIILEKLLGLSTSKDFIDFIIYSLDNPAECPWRELLSIILKFQGEYSRVAIIQAIGFDFYAWKNGVKRNEKERLNVYIKLLEMFVDIYNQIYKESVLSVRKLGNTILGISELKFNLLEKRSWIQQFGTPVFQNDSRDSFGIEQREIQEFLEILKSLDKKQENNEKKIEFIKKQCYIKKRIMPFYLELDIESRRMWFTNHAFDENTTIRNEVRSIVINENKNKYKNKYSTV